MRAIPLSKGYMAIVDDKDYHRLSKFKWQAFAVPGRRMVYAVRRQLKSESVTPGRIRMHHEVFGKRIPLDHKDGVGINNTRENLRPATKSQNAANFGPGKDSTTGFRGVSLHFDGRWRARIMCQGISHHIGLFKTKSEAAKAYDTMAKRLFGEFAYQNIH